MEDVETLVKTSIGEIEKLLNTKTVVGEPITVEENTLIPLISMSFGFGAGSGSAKDDKGGRAGAGGGGGTKPVAVIVVNKDGANVQPVVGGMSGAAERIAEVIAKAIERRVGQKKEE